MKTMYLAKFSAPVLAGLMVLAVAACEDEKSPEEVVPPNPTALTIQTIIVEPKVAAPSDTLLFTAVVTSASPNVGDYPVMTWTASAGTFIENNEMSVRWVAPGSSSIASITVKAKNDANTATGRADVYVGTGQALVLKDAGQVNLIGAGPDFRYLRTVDVTRGLDVYEHVGGVDADAVDNVTLVTNTFNVAYSPDGLLEAHQSDSLASGAQLRPRHIYLGDFGTNAIRTMTKDRPELIPPFPERSQFSYPAFSPNSQVLAYQGWLHSTGGTAPDSFHVFVHDLVLNQRTLVTYEHEAPRAFWPSFSTDGNWLTYVVDRSRTGAWDLYGSPMTGNTVDGSLASLKRMTNTGGILVVGAPRDIKPPVMAWSPSSPTLGIVASDGALYLVTTNAGGSTVIDVPEVIKAQELVWSPSGALLAATTGGEIFTMSPGGVVTPRVTGVSGDILRDLVFSPDENWMLFRVTRGTGAWFEVLDIGAGVLTAPIPITSVAPAGDIADYRAAMSMSPVWTNTNVVIFPQFGVDPAAETPGIVSRDLSGLID